MCRMGLGRERRCDGRVRGERWAERGLEDGLAAERTTRRGEVARRDCRIVVAEGGSREGAGGAVGEGRWEEEGEVGWAKVGAVTAVVRRPER